MQIGKLNLGWGAQGGNGNVAPPTTTPATNTQATPAPSWFDIFAAILGVQADIVKLGVGYARIAYRKLVVAAFAIIGMIFCEFILDVIAGHFPGTTSHVLHGINITLGCLFGLAYTILSGRPKQVAWIGTAGAIIGLLDRHDVNHGGISNGVKWIINEYYKIAKTILLIATICSFFLSGVLPFSQNPMAFFYIICGGIIIGLMTERYEYLQGRFAIQFVHYAVVVAMVLVIVSLIPASSFGDITKFKGAFFSGLTNNIKEGLLVSGILLTLLVVFGMRHHDAEEKDKKTYKIYFVLAFGIFDMMFMPMDVLWGGIMGEYSHEAPPHHVATPAIVSAASPQPVHIATLHNAKEIDLSYDWTPELQLTPGVKAVTWCSGPGAEMRMFFDGGVSQYTSGVVLTCRNAGDAYENRWDGLRNVRIQFHCAKDTEQAVCDNLKVTKASFY